MEYVRNDKIWNNKYKLLHGQMQQISMQYNEVHNENVNTLNCMHKVLLNKDSAMKQMESDQQNVMQELNNNHCTDIQKQLKQMQNKYKVLNEETLCDYNSMTRNKEPPTKHYKDKTIEYIKTILWKQKKYYYNYDDLLELFDEILKDFGVFVYNFKDSLLTV